jgi:hypothetical protein
LISRTRSNGNIPILNRSYRTANLIWFLNSILPVNHSTLQRAPTATHSLPSVPFPLPLISRMGYANGVKPVFPPFSPAPPVGSPCLAF